MKCREKRELQRFIIFSEESQMSYFHQIKIIKEEKLIQALI